MGRRPNPVPSVLLNVALPQTVHAQMTLHLFSELEGRVPQGAYQRFLTERIQEFFKEEPLDLAPYALGVGPGEMQIHGHPSAVALVKRLLEGATA